MEKYDLVVIGSGIAGCTTAQAAFSNYLYNYFEKEKALGASIEPLRILLLEQKSHPRFTIGESTIPSTTVGFTLISRLLHLNEICEDCRGDGESLTSFLASKSLGLIAYPKSHFYFAHHEENREIAGDPELQHHELLFETFRPPLGPDSHLIRSTLDHYLLKRTENINQEAKAKYYGNSQKPAQIDVHQLTSIVDFDNSDKSRPYVTLTIKHHDEALYQRECANPGSDQCGRTEVQHSSNDDPHDDEGGHSNPVAKEGEKGVIRKIEARFVIDCSGHSAFLSRKLGLIQKEPDFYNRTRGIYSHFRCRLKRAGSGAVNSGNATEGEDMEYFSLDDAFGGPSQVFRYSRDSGTMHHCFDGGWIWVIPFDNDSVSVGLILDIDKYPYDASKSKEEEFWYYVSKYPTVLKHLRVLRGKEDRPYIRTGRIQLKSNSIISNRVLLAPHASAFIDPLFSTGINMTTRFILRAIPPVCDLLHEERVLQVKGHPIPELNMLVFQQVEDRFFREADFIDKMVSGMFKSFRNFELFRQYWRIWIDATTRQITDGVANTSITSLRTYATGISEGSNIIVGKSAPVELAGGPLLPLYGSHHPDWKSVVDQCHSLVFSTHKEREKLLHEGWVDKAKALDRDTAYKVYDLLESIPSSYSHFPMKVLAPNWKVEFPYKTNVMVPLNTPSMMSCAAAVGETPLEYIVWLSDAALKMSLFWGRYFVTWGSNWHNAVDVIQNQITFEWSLRRMINTISLVGTGFIKRKNVYASDEDKKNA